MDDRIISEVYPVITSTHPSWPVVIYGIIISFVTISGILSNFCVILVTIRTNAFRGSVNILLAFYSLCEIVNLSGNFLSIFTAFSGNYFMPLKDAFYFMVIPFEATGCAINLMLFIGIERLFVVLLPLKRFHQKLYLAIVCHLVLFFIIASTIIIPKCFWNNFASTEIFSNGYEIWRIINCTDFALLGLVTMLILFILYALIAVALHCKKAPSNVISSDHSNRRIFRSLLTIVVVNMGGYFAGLFVFFVIFPMFNQNAFVVWHANQISGLLLHFSASSNGPILYCTSLEYRTAFRKEFACFFKLIYCCWKRSVIIVPQQFGPFFEEFPAPNPTSLHPTNPDPNLQVRFENGRLRVESMNKF